MASRRPSRRYDLRGRWRQVRAGVRRWYRKHFVTVVGGPTPYGQALREQAQARMARPASYDGPRPGHYSRPRPAPTPHTRQTSTYGRQTTMTTSKLSARALAMLPPECRHIVTGAEQVAQWRPDTDSPATDTQHRLATVGLAMSRQVDAYGEVLDTLTSMNVDRRVTQHFAGAVDTLAAAAEAMSAAAAKFAELYAAQMDQEDQTVSPLVVPGARRAA